LVSNGVSLTEKTDRGDYKVDIKTLENFKHLPVVEEYLDYQKEVGIYQKFIKPYCELQSFVIRPNIMLFGTETGRLSCSNPNVQQIPNRSLFKDIFRSRFKEQGVIASIDLDQAELRIAALLSGDEIYSQALLSNDFHRLVASKTFGKVESEVTKAERFVAKSVNFGGVLYGGSANGIATRIKVDPSVVAKVQEWYKQEFIKLTTWIESQKQLAVKINQVQTHFGRVRSLEFVHDRKMRWDEKRRIGVNTAVQSVASDVMLYIVTRLSSLLRKHRLQSKILFPVHDELLLDIQRQELQQVIELLKQSFKDVLKTPIGKLELSRTLPISGTLEWGESWLYLKSDHYKPEGKVKISSLE
jgi:DNA polymerase-1